MFNKVNLSEILHVHPSLLDELDAKMKRSLDKSGVLGSVEQQISAQLKDRVEKLGLKEGVTSAEVYNAVFRQVKQLEDMLIKHVGVDRTNFDFEKVVRGARSMTTDLDGFFLKREFAEKILKVRPPAELLKYLGYDSVDALLEKEDVGEIFSALRFIESDAWMHETFDVAYTKFTPDDFEHRKIEVKVLGDQWEDVAKKFVAKKHHNVSHLKEFGIIFLNPIAETEPGNFLRDFALLLHYLHEISYYSRLFERYAESSKFNERFISLLRGDVPEVKGVEPGQWLIIQRYLWKADPRDVRLFLPRVNPEALHWRKAQKDITGLSSQDGLSDLAFWDDLDFVAGFFTSDGSQELVSFDMEDSAMSFVASSQNLETRFIYHQQEALWNKIFAEYVGGYDALEEYLIENMEKAMIQF